MGRKKGIPNAPKPAIDLRPANFPMRPGFQEFVDRMGIVAHEIWMESTGPSPNWYVVELKARELATMAEMRRNKL